MREKTTRGKKTASLDTLATADDKLQRHLRALGLDSAEAYRAWCREHGFRDSLRKNWQEWREERQAAEKAAAAQKSTAAGRRHLQAIGFPTLEEYQAWCRQHGFSPTLNKSPDQRHHELRTRERVRGQQALTEARRRTRRPSETIQAIFSGELRADELKGSLFPRLHALAAAAATTPPVHAALLRLLLHVEKRADLLHLDPAIGVLGPQAGNSYLEALAALARHEHTWLRPPEEWAPESRSRRRQFGSLARHLLARYPVPAFMDAAWFRGDSPEAARQRGWFIHIGGGKNIRTADVPVGLTKMMAHEFLHAPDDSSIEAALRWGQIRGMGGDESLVRAVVGTRLGDTFEHEEFWQTVLQWFVNNPMLDTACVGPIVDYIHHQKLVPREIVADDGTVHRGDPSLPDFSMKGRTVGALLARVEEWHAHLARETRRPQDRWERSDIPEYHSLQVDRQSGNVMAWTIRELLTSRELRDEGKALNHCVASYARSCANGCTSVWSIRVEDIQQATPRPVMTVAIKSRSITQARGKANALPGSKKGGPRLDQALAILRQWARQEGIGFKQF
jgi:hypothetical protein